MSEDDTKTHALNSPEVKRLLNGNSPKRVLYVTGRGMVNIVV